MSASITTENVKSLVDGLNFAEKVERSLSLIKPGLRRPRSRAGGGQQPRQGLLRGLASGQGVSPDIRGFIVTTRFKPQ